MLRLVCLVGDGRGQVAESVDGQSLAASHSHKPAKPSRHDPIGSSAVILHVADLEQAEAVQDDDGVGARLVDQPDRVAAFFKADSHQVERLGAAHFQRRSAGGSRTGPFPGLVHTISSRCRVARR